MNYTNIKQAILLNEKQDAYLREQIQGFPRHKALDTFRSLAVLEDTHYEKKGFSANLTAGQFVVSTSELAKLWKCDRKTAITIIEEFNELGFLVSIANNRTTLHSIQCICCWYVDELTEPIKNPFYNRHPICLSKEQRATLSKEVMTGKDSQEGMPTLSKDFLDLFVSLEAEKAHDSQESVEESEEQESKPMAVQSSSSLISNDMDSKIDSGDNGFANNLNTGTVNQTSDPNHTPDSSVDVITPQQNEIHREVTDELHSKDGASIDRDANNPETETSSTPPNSNIL